MENFKKFEEFQNGNYVHFHPFSNDRGTFFLSKIDKIEANESSKTFNLKIILYNADKSSIHANDLSRIRLSQSKLIKLGFVKSKIGNIDVFKNGNLILADYSPAPIYTDPITNGANLLYCIYDENFIVEGILNLVKLKEESFNFTSLHSLQNYLTYNSNKAKGLPTIDFDAIAPNLD